MTNKFITVLCACLLCLTALAQGIHAEEYTDVPADTPPAAVEPTPAEEAPTQALATPTPDPDATPEPEQPEPTPQIIVIQATPETAPTPEPTIAPTIWDKPFNDYSPTEGLLLVIFVALCFTALLIWLR